MALDDVDLEGDDVREGVAAQRADVAGLAVGVSLSLQLLLPLHVLLSLLHEEPAELPQWRRGWKVSHGEHVHQPVLSEVGRK